MVADRKLQECVSAAGTPLQHNTLRLLYGVKIFYGLYVVEKLSCVYWKKLSLFQPSNTNGSTKFYIYIESIEFDSLKLKKTRLKKLVFLDKVYGRPLFACL